MLLASKTANDEANTTARKLDGGTIRFYAGPEPASADEALGPDNKLLVECRFRNPSAPPAVDGLVTFTVLEGGRVAIGGTATFCRTVTQNGDTVWQSSIGSEIELEDPNLPVGATFALTSLAYQVGVRGV